MWGEVTRVFRSLKLSTLVPGQQLNWYPLWYTQVQFLHATNWKGVLTTRTKGGCRRLKKGILTDAGRRWMSAFGFCRQKPKNPAAPIQQSAYCGQVGV